MLQVQASIGSLL